MQYHNFHTHSIYSDGENTLREMIDSAVSKGFSALGFSDHSYAKSEEDYCMTRGGTVENYREVRALAEEYSDKIKIYAGIEQDAESAMPELDYDFIIASVHETVRRGISMPIDSSADEQKELVRVLFGGSFTDFAKAYFNNMTEHVMRSKTDIIGHFDLITKYSLAPENDEEYMSAAAEAVAECVKYCKVFELNTGAIARGYREKPYPAEFILDEIKRLGGEIIVTSDCHYADKLTEWFDEAEMLLLSHGFKADENSALNDKINGIRLWK